jgi:predicted dehydrogenase
MILRDRSKEPEGETRMPANDRRTFLSRAALGAAAAAAGLRGAVASSSNGQLVMGGIGCGGQGTNLIRSFAGQEDVRVAWVCDPDLGRANAAAQAVEDLKGSRPQVAQDLRRILDDPQVDGVSIGTPDHWHAPATILAVNAGKHVYVEKPCSHNIREGRLMTEAARRNNRVVQVGTQSRSSPPVVEAMDLLRQGAIGDILVAKAWNSQQRGTIGRASPSEPPSSLNYDLWLGPAPFVPFQSNRLHSGWHWWYDFGTGDTGNDGVHDIDIARWGLGVETHPSRVSTLGGKYYFDDDQQFPDTQYALFEYPADSAGGKRRQLIFEMRIWSPYRQEGYENGCAFYGTEGMLLLGKNDGWQLFGPRNEPRESRKASGMGLPHHRNFVECIRAGRLPNADVEIGHLSATLCHLANISTRVGRTIQFDPAAERILNDEEADRLVRREYREHWARPEGG